VIAIPGCQITGSDLLFNAVIPGFTRLTILGYGIGKSPDTAGKQQSQSDREVATIRE